MFPPDPPSDGPGKGAERMVYEALRALPEGYFVYHGYRFIDRETAHEGEADFIVLHREKGFLLLECKGFGVRRTAEGQWVREYEGRETPLKKDPFGQAEDGCHALIRGLEKGMERVFGRRTPFPLPYGHAVVFPFAKLKEGLLPPGMPRETLYDAWDVARLAERIPETMAFWARNRGGTPAEFPEFDRFRKKVLQPKLDLVSGLDATVAGEEAALLRLTREQAWVMDALLDNRRFRVEGGAGTGKTLMALELVHRLADAGERTLLVCFNRALGFHLEVAMKSWDIPPGKVRATFFHDLCREGTEALGLPFVEPDGPEDKNRFFNHEAPEALLRALDKGLMPRWDAVVVDEGQDFVASWWLSLEAKLIDRDTGRLMVFYDPRQILFGWESAVPIDLPVLKLRRNQRNTRAIAEVVCDLGGGDQRPHEDAPEGEPVAVRTFGDGEGPETVREALDTATRNLLKQGLKPEQIAVITPHRWEHSSLKGCETLGGVRLSRDPAERMGAVLHATISGFKGLESDAVLLADIRPGDPRCSREARYVAASRAKHILQVFAYGDWRA